MSRSLIAPCLAAVTLLAAQRPVAAQSQLLGRVPAQAHTVVHVQDATAVLEQIQLNDVYRLLGDEAGDPLRGVMRDMSPEDFDSMLLLGSALAGEAVLFKSKAGAGLMVEPGGDRGSLMAAVRAFTQTPELDEGMTVQRLGACRVESTAPLDLEAPAATGGREVIELASLDAELVKVMISGPDIIAAVSGPPASVTAWTRALCGPVADSAPAPIATKLRAARGKHGPAGQMEFFTDLSFFKDEAAAALKQAGEGMSIDPSRLIGLEDDAFLYGTFALPAGMNLDIRFHLEVKPGTLLAKLADTMRPVPSDLLGKIPAEVTGLHCMHWDFNRCYEVIREALRADQQERGAERLDQAVAAGSALAGSDLEEEFFGQFTGVFGLFFMPPEDRLSLADLEGGFFELILQMGLFARVEDTDTTLEAFEALVGAARADLSTVEDERGFDRMVPRDLDPWTGGLAFGAGHFLLTATHRVMDATLTTVSGDTARSLLSGGKLQAIFDGQQGAAAISAFRLGMLRQLIREEERGVKLPEGMEGLYETYVVTTIRRARDGFNLRVQLQ